MLCFVLNYLSCYKKMDVSGYNEFKLLISSSIDEYQKEKNIVDHNYPFQPYSTYYEIMSKMIKLYEQTIQSTLNLMDIEELLKVMQALHNADHITIFPTIGNYFMAECFKQNMLEIGVRVDIAIHPYDQHWSIVNMKDNSVVIITSYAHRTPWILETMKELRQTPAKIISISSVEEAELSKLADYHLYISSYEDSEEKIASFSSRLSLQYLYDCIYACYFNRDYMQNLSFKIKNYID